MPESGRSKDEGWSAQRIRASWSSVLLAIVAVVAVVVAQGVFVAASQPLGWVVAAAAVAFVIAPLVQIQSRWIPRGVAILTTLVVGLALIASVGVALVFEVQEQLDQLSEELPAAAARLEADQGPDGLFRQIELESLVQDLVDQTTDRVAPDPIEGAVGTGPSFLVSGVLVVFFLIWGRSMFDGLCRQISDPDRQSWFAEWSLRSAALGQRYLVAALAIAGAVTALGTGLAWLVDLPTPLVLGLALGAGSVIPYIGVLFGGAPLLLLSVADETTTLTTLALGFAVIGLQAAATVVTRIVVEARTLRVGPAVIVVGALLGSDMYGIGGALVAIVAGVLAMSMIQSAIDIEPPANDRDRAAEEETESTAP